MCTSGIDALECGYHWRYPMKAAAYPLLLATVLGFAPPAAAQVTPGDPAGNQTIPEKDRSRPQDMLRAKKMETRLSAIN